MSFITEIRQQKGTMFGSAGTSIAVTSFKMCKLNFVESYPANPRCHYW